jgi:hypothetical protein
MKRPWSRSTRSRILGQFFFADDFANLFEVANFGGRDLIMAPAVGHLSAVRNAVLALSFFAFGMHAGLYFAMVLVTHVLNVVLLFAVALRLTGRTQLACFAAILFGISPMNVGMLGWYATYGHVLATAGILGALVLLVDDDDRAPLPVSSALVIAVCALAASQSFGTGAACASVLPVVALLLRPGLVRSRVSALVVVSIPAMVALAAWAILVPKTRLNPSPALSNQLTIIAARDWRHWMPMDGGGIFPRPRGDGDPEGTARLSGLRGESGGQVLRRVSGHRRRLYSLSSRQRVRRSARLLHLVRPTRARAANSRLADGSVALPEWTVPP